MTRGINQNFELWKKYMETMWFNFRQTPLLKDDKGNYLKDEKGDYVHGKEQIARVQGALRPLQLFEYVFPQESLQEVLAMINMHKSYNELRPEVTKYGWMMRKITGYKKIPDMPDLKKKEAWEVTSKYVPMFGMAVYPLGIREDIVQDYTFPDGQGFHQEGL